MYYYDQDDILKILKTVRDAGLIAPDGMLSAGVAELQKDCNGIGADWMDSKSRKILTRLLKYAEATAAVHDWLYSRSDGTEPARAKADDLFLINGYREIDFKYPSLWNWRRWRAKATVTAAHTILKRIGVVAWRLVYAETKLKEEGKLKDENAV